MIGETGPDPILESTAALESFIESFLDGTFPVAQWHHRQHVIMAAWHLLRYSEQDAMGLLRERIRSYNLAQGGVNSDTSGYHETLTRFWLRIVAQALGLQPSGMPEIERIAVVADQLGNRTGLHREYYGFDVVRSVEARRTWVSPDLRPL